MLLVKMSLVMKQIPFIPTKIKIFFTTKNVLLHFGKSKYDGHAWKETFCLLGRKSLNDREQNLLYKKACFFRKYNNPELCSVQNVSSHSSQKLQM